MERQQWTSYRWRGFLISRAGALCVRSSASSLSETWGRRWPRKPALSPRGETMREASSAVACEVVADGLWGPRSDERCSFRWSS